MKRILLFFINFHLHSFVLSEDGYELTADMLSQKPRRVNIYIDKADEMIYYLPIHFTTEVE